MRERLERDYGWWLASKWPLPFFLLSPNIESSYPFRTVNKSIQFTRARADVASLVSWWRNENSPSLGNVFSKHGQFENRLDYALSKARYVFFKWILQAKFIRLCVVLSIRLLEDLDAYSAFGFVGNSWYSKPVSQERRGNLSFELLISWI